MASSGDAAGATGASSEGVREASGVEVGVAIGLVAETLSTATGGNSWVPDEEVAAGTAAGVPSGGGGGDPTPPL